MQSNFFWIVVPFHFSAETIYCSTPESMCLAFITLPASAHPFPTSVCCIYNSSPLYQQMIIYHPPTHVVTLSNPYICCSFICIAGVWLLVPAVCCLSAGYYCSFIIAFASSSILYSIATAGLF